MPSMWTNAEKLQEHIESLRAGLQTSKEVTEDYLFHVSEVKALQTWCERNGIVVSTCIRNAFRNGEWNTFDVVITDNQLVCACAGGNKEEALHYANKFGAANLKVLIASHLPEIDF